jgi:hypothetical protein
MPVAPDSAPNPYACLGSIAVFFVIITPIYLMLRYFVKLIRWSYGFDVPPEDPGPPLRICEGCHNTVLELDFQHCPYCGRMLPPVAEPNPQPEKGAGVVSESDLAPDLVQPFTDDGRAQDA